MCSVPRHSARLPPADRVFYCVGFDRAAGASMKAVYVDGLANVLDYLPATVTSPRLRELDRRLRPDRPGVGRRRVAGLSATRVRQGLPRGGATPAQLGSTSAAYRLSSCDSPASTDLAGSCAGRFWNNGEPIPGDPTKFLNLIHIDDAARAAVAALAAAEAGASLPGQRRPAGHPRRILFADGNAPAQHPSLDSIRHRREVAKRPATRPTSASATTA